MLEPCLVKVQWNWAAEHGAAVAQSGSLPGLREGWLKKVLRWSQISEGGAPCSSEVLQGTTDLPAM